MTCSPCPSGQYQSQSGQVSCTPWQSCALSVTYQTIAPTSTSDRVCTGVSAACDPSTSYQTSGPTLTSDRACLPLTSCSRRQFISVQATATSDRVCTNCAVCPAGSTAVTTSCTLAMDTQCTACTACSSDQFETSPCLPLSDRKCSSLTVCPVGYSETTAPTLTSDRICSSAPASVDDQPPSSNVFVNAQVSLSGVPNPVDLQGNPTASFLLVFSDAVRLTVKDVAGYVAVTVFGVQVESSRRSTTSVTVEYRISATTSNVVSVAQLQSTAQDTSVLAQNLLSVGSTVTSDDYSNVQVTSSTATAVVGTSTTTTSTTTPAPASTTKYIDQSTVQSGADASTSSSSSNSNTVIGASIGAGLGIICVVLVALFFLRSTKSNDVDLTGDLESENTMLTTGISA